MQFWPRPRPCPLLVWLTSLDASDNITPVVIDDDDDYYYFYSRNSHLSTLAIARFTTLLHITSGVRSFVLG